MVTEHQQRRAYVPLHWLLVPVFMMISTGLAAAQVYVANQLEGTVSVISTPGNTVIATIPVGTQPVAVAITPSGQFVYVANRVSGNVSKIAAASNTVVNTISVGGTVRGVRVSPDGSSLFVVANNSLFRFSVATDQPTGTFLLPASDPDHPPVPFDVDITPDEQFAYVADNATAICSVYPINLATGAILTSTECASKSFSGAVGGSFPRAVAVRPDGQFVYATAFQDGALQVVRVSDNTYVGGGCAGTFGCSGAGPQGLVISPDSQFAFTTNTTENKVAIFPLAPSGPPLSAPTHVSLPSSPAAYLDITPDGRFLYVTHGASFVSVIDLQATPPSVIQTITVEVNSFPQGIAVSPLASSGLPPPPPPPPTLSVAPGSLGFTGEQGLADPASQSLTIGNAGSGTLTWSAAGSVNGGLNWLSLNPGTGVAPPSASLAASANTCGAVAGSYSGSVTVTSAGATSSPQSIPVTLSVTPPVGVLSVPSARICTNQAAYQTGDLLRLSASLRQGATSNVGDAYLFSQLPGTATFLSLVLSQNGIVPALGPTPVPFAKNLSVFDYAGEVFSRFFDGGELQGTYTVTAILARLDSDPLVPANQLVTATSNFSFTP